MTKNRTVPHHDLLYCDAPMTKHEIHQQGMLLVFSGPSGAGKTSITRALLDHFPDAVFSVSATTRDKADNETDGVDYHYITAEQFLQHVQQNDFLEHAQYDGNSYGTLSAPTEQSLAQGKLVVLDIDIQGAQQIKTAKPEAFGIFILPPNDDVLLERLRERKRESEEVIQRRFNEARREIKDAMDGDLYNVFVVNDDLQTAINKTIDAIEQELAIRATTA